ncbi:nitroreductase family protein [Alkalihalobacterium bogoriense]|uniref:nitroreductase family protein n=1 Tax=Alkalihalobacterium bogoriense TaxID=246272 RepID=UPI00047BC0A3|nr:nitroreductase family protein [Alkalihalobacterium bogoriense]
MSTQTTHKNLSVQEAIESRHSVRKFKEETLTKADIEEIIQLTKLAPSAWNLQPWRFHAVMDTKMKQELQEAAYGQTQVTSAPCVILVVSDMEDVIAHIEETIHPGVPEDKKKEEIANLSAFFGSMTIEERGQWGLTQTNIALGFLLLAAEGLGYSSVPMLGFDQIKIKSLLQLKEHEKICAMVPVGHKAEEGYPHHRHTLERITVFH